MAIFNKKKQNAEENQKNPSQTAENAPQDDVSAEEQLMRRQSAPRPTAESEARRMYEQQQAKMMMGQGRDASGAMDGFKALAQVIGREQIQAANLTLNRYKEGKANLERKIVDNEQWYKQRHWEQMRDKKQDIEPSSAWLFNSIANKHADAMDNFPSPNVLPREEGDKAEAEMLSSIIPVILDQNDFEETYDAVQNYKLKTGAGVYGVFWDKSKMNGLGDISIQKIDLINLFWESGVMDIQKSRNVFHVELMDNDVLLGAYPQLQGKLGSAVMDVTKYIYDDKVDTTNKSVVVDWYYKKNMGGNPILRSNMV